MLVYESDSTSGLILGFHLGMGQRSVMTIKILYAGIYFFQKKVWFLGC